MSIDSKDNLFNGSSGAFVEELFARYSRDPSSVDPSWQQYFQELVNFCFILILRLLLVL